MTIVQDGTGLTTSLKVDTSNRAYTLADQRSELYALNLQGRVFAAPFSLTPTGGASVFAWIGNTFSGMMLRIYQLDIICAAAEVVVIHTDNAFTLAADSAGTLVSMNTAGQFNLAPSSSASTAGTVNFRTGNAITGAAAGSILAYLGLGANLPFSWKPLSAFLLTPSKTLYLKTTTGGNAVTGIIYFSVEPQ